MQDIQAAVAGNHRSVNNGLSLQHISSAPVQLSAPSGNISCWRASKSGIEHRSVASGAAAIRRKSGLERFVTTTVSPASTHLASKAVS